jgi:hypothetical protein
MDNSLLIGLILGAVNFIPGVLLAVFYRPVGTWCAHIGKELCKYPFLRIFLFEKLYEEQRSRMFILMIGIWLTAVGIGYVFLIPALMTYVRQQ